MPRQSLEKPIGAEQAAFSALKLVEERAFAQRERDRYVSRSLGYLVLLNGASALVLMAVVALNPESSSHRLAWAMIVFGSGAIAGLLSSLLAYIRRLFAISLPTHVLIRDFLRIGAIVMAIGAGAAFLTGMNMVSLTVPEGSTTRMKNKPEKPPSQTKPESPSPISNHVRFTCNSSPQATSRV